MAFLAQVAAYLLEKLIVWGGKALYDWANNFIDKQKQKQIEEENRKAYKKALDEKLASEIRRKRASDLLNNNDPKSP